MAYKKYTYLTFSGIQNTFYKSNFPRFQPINGSNTKTYLFNLLELINAQNIELNSVILNDFLFSNLRSLKLFGDIVSIEKGLFKSFKKLKQIALDLLSIRKLIQRQNDWLFDLNSDINVDIYNYSLESPFIKNDTCVGIYIFFYYEQGLNVKNMDLNDYLPDEDFCIYAKIPIQQLIFITFNLYYIEDEYTSCIYLWMIRNQQILFDFCQKYRILNLFEINEILNITKFDECNFNKR